MPHFALIGKSLGHSFSKQYFDENFSVEGRDYSYRLLPMPSLAELGPAIERYQLSGFNVTIPYKEKILPLLDGISQEAHAIGAVNVVKCQGRQLIGFNTDAPAFGETIEPLLSPHHTEALILGNGGAAKAVRYALENRNIRCHIVSRNPGNGTIGYPEASEMLSRVFLVVNTTPVGTYPDVDQMPPIALDHVDSRHLCYDLIYNPSSTALMKAFAAQGAVAKGGLDMLHRQAELSWEIWGIKQK